jgi:NADH:ubiquinone oxidoreductase subunit 3 (subunit A)
MSNDDSKSQKLAVLYTQLQTHNLFLRERMFQIAQAAVTVLLLIDGWLLSVTNKVQWPRSGVFFTGIILVFSTSLYSVYSHYKEYLASAKMIVRVETAMGAYKSGEYLDSDSLYEAASQEWGTGKYSSHLIRTYSVVLILFTVFSCGIVVLF